MSSPTPPSSSDPGDDAPVRPSPGSGRARPWLEIARISNLPTVWTNALVGFVTGVATVGTGRSSLGVETIGRLVVPAIDLGRPTRLGIALALVVLGTSAIYTAGMILNDVFDRAIDARERPGRPIPSGRIPLRAARLAGWGLLVAGIACCALVSTGAAFAASVLALAVVAYDLLHARTAASVVLMGACRGLVYLVAGVAAAAASGGLVPAVPLAMLGAFVALHTIGFSMVAREEVAPATDAPVECPACDHAIAPDQSRCPECGLAFNSPEAARTASRAGRMRRRAVTWLPLSVPLLLPSALICLVGGAALVNWIRTGSPPDLELPITASVVGAIVSVGMSALLASHLLRNAIGIIRMPLRVGPFVLGSIVAFSLFDATILALRGDLLAMAAALACVLVVRAAHKRIAGT